MKRLNSLIYAVMWALGMCCLFLPVHVSAQALIAAPTTIAFGNVLVGQTSAAQTLTLRNDLGQSAAATVQSIGGLNASIAITQTGGSCPAVVPFVLPVGASCTLAFTFSPTQPVIVDATLQIVADTGTLNVPVSARGGVTAPLPTFSPSQYNFGLGSPFWDVVVTFTNPGTQPLDLLGFVGANTNVLAQSSFDFSIDGGSCARRIGLVFAFYVVVSPLAAGDSCTLAITFNPLQPGNRSGTLTLQTGAGDVSVPMFGSRGTLTANALQPTPTTLFFGGQLVGSTGQQMLTLTNPGPLSSTVFGADPYFTNPAPITLSGGSCPVVFPFALASMASCTLQINFSPTAAGVQGTEIRLRADTGNFAVNVIGVGTEPPPPTITPTPLDFGSNLLIGGAPVTLTATVTNPANVAVSFSGLLGLATTPTVIDPYRLNSGTCTTAGAGGSVLLIPSLPALTSCTLHVTFDASFATSSGIYDRTLTLQSSLGNATTPMFASVVSLLSPPALTPATATFSSAASRNETRTITLTNTAPVVTTISTVRLGSGYSSTVGSCGGTPFSLAPAASCTFDVIRTPGAPASDVSVVSATGAANLTVRIATSPLTSVTLTTVPAGLRLSVDGQLMVTPRILQVEAGSTLTLAARAQNLGTSGYTLASWSDSGAAARPFVVPSIDSSVTATFSATTLVPKLDVDNDGTLNAATDGMLVLRYLLGIRGAALTGGLQIPATAERPTETAITAYLDQIRSNLDIDGSGSPAAVSDGVLIVRYLLRKSGAALFNNAPAPGPRTQEQMQSALDAMAP